MVWFVVFRYGAAIFCSGGSGPFLCFGDGVDDLAVGFGELPVGVGARAAFFSFSRFKDVHEGHGDQGRGARDGSSSLGGLQLEERWPWCSAVIA